MKRNIIETIIGAVVLSVAAFFLVFSYKTGNAGTSGGFSLVADFSGIGGLKTGDDVQISGVKVGTVSDVMLDPDSYLARVKISIDPSIKIPSDTAALISSESLLGGRYLALEPGANDDDLLPEGGRIQFTQAPQNLEQLLGQFIFSVSGEDKGGEGEAPAAAEGEPAAAPLGAMPPLETPAPADDAPVEESAHP